MTWKSHIAIAVAITLPFAPVLAPVAAFGATAPDWSEWILRFFGRRVTHRGVTHYVYIPIAIVLFAIAIAPIFPFLSPIVAAFGVGYLSHWFADALTVSGVPVSGASSYRVHFFGGRIRTGQGVEYVIAFGLLAVSVLVFMPAISSISGAFSANTSKGMEFEAYKMDYKNLYEKHIIDESERLATRFKFF